MSRHPESEAIIKSKGAGRELNVTSPSYCDYRANAASLSLTIAAVPSITATHPWHGDRSNRLYTTRENFFPRDSSGESAVERRADGLLKYTQPAPLAHEYFATRREDG